MARFRRRREAASTAARQAREMRSQAEQVALARRAIELARAARAWDAALAGGATAEGPDFQPIAGVGLGQFAAVSRGIAAFGHDRSKLGHVAASAGIAAEHWEAAAQGWRDRIQSNHAVARRFNQLYRESWA